MFLSNVTTQPLAKFLSLSETHFSVHLEDGRILSIPLNWYPRLLQATPAELQNWQLLGDGYAIEWPSLDEHIGIDGLLAGHKSGESSHSFTNWLAQRTSTSEG